MTYDVVIIGLGVVGSACAAELARRELRVLGVEQFTRGHSHGSSHGQSRMFRELHPGRPGLTSLAGAAKAMWLQLMDETRLALFRPGGGLLIGDGDDPDWVARTGEAGDIGVHHELVRDPELRELIPQFRVPPGSLGYYEPGAGVLFAGQCVRALQDTAMGAGARLQFDTIARVAAPDALDEDRPVALRVGDDRVLADRVVFAAGPWTAAMNLGGMTTRLTVERALVHWVDFEPMRAACGVSSPFVCFTGDEFAVLPWLPGHGVKYGRFHTGQIVDPDRVDRTVRPEETLADTELLNRYIPGLRLDHPTRSNVCLYTHTPDGSFALGYVGPRVLVLSTCSGMGFKFAPALGRIVADSLLGGPGHEPALPIARWR